jgi:hypothetical protein
MEWRMTNLGLSWTVAVSTWAISTSALAGSLNSSDALKEALQSAKGGETLELAPGNYGALVLNGNNGGSNKYTKTVTIRSADPNNPATFASVNMVMVSNVTFADVTFDYTYAAGEPDYYSPFYFESVTGLTLTSVTVDGDVANGTGTYADGFPYAYGINCTDCEDLTIENSSIQGFYRGIYIDTVKNLTFSGNDVSGMRAMGIGLGAVDGANIENNFFHAFKTNPDSPDHPDMIQMWTASTKYASSDIRIHHNILDSGGSGWTQSIFNRNEKVDTGEAGDDFFFKNIEVSDNLIRNYHLHGISIGETHGVKIVNNTLIQARETPAETGLLHVPQINVVPRSTKVEIVNNISPEPPNAGQPIGRQWKIKGNVLAQRHKESGNNAYGSVFVNALSESAVTIEDLQVLPFKTVIPKGVGSSYSRFNDKPAHPRAIIGAKKLAGPRKYELSIRAMFGPKGEIGTAVKSVTWRMQNGTEASGTTALVTLDQGGINEVEADVLLEDGTLIRARRALKAR